MAAAYQQRSDNSLSKIIKLLADHKPSKHTNNTSRNFQVLPQAEVQSLASIA